MRRTGAQEADRALGGNGAMFPETNKREERDKHDQSEGEGETQTRGSDEKVALNTGRRKWNNSCRNKKCYLDPHSLGKMLGA